MDFMPDVVWESLSPEQKQLVHEEHVAEARDHLETLMSKAELPEESKQRLRRMFPGTDKGGMKQAVNIEKRSLGGAR
jgi:alpha-D-ribose 1-methylphosphonate 5-triphosphate synthase subunit PhnL